jgi:hypothetical protein
MKIKYFYSNEINEIIKFVNEWNFKFIDIKQIYIKFDYGEYFYILIYE